jgi:hypothetical protein
MTRLTITTPRILWSLLGLAAVMLLAGTAQAAEPRVMIGERGPLFSLASSQETLVDYVRDYYGKHHLVLTFVPAAFTPV